MSNHINDIEIKNFKSIRHQKIEGCKRINLFIGYPNVGKSNILEALSLFSINSSSTDLSDFVRFESPSTLFFNGNVNEGISIKLNDRVRILVSLNNTFLDFVIQEESGSNTFEKYDKDKSDFFPLNNVELKQRCSFQINFENDQKNIREFKEFGIKKPFGVDFCTKKYKFKGIFLEKSHEQTQLNSPNGSNLFNVLLSNKQLKTEVEEYFKLYDLKFAYDFSNQNFTILKMIGNDVFSIPFTMIADTLQRLIFHKAAIQTNKDSVLLFEEPEAHCFEPYIMEITNAIKNDENNNQFFIVTHSQYVIDELLRDEESRKNTNIYLVNSENNETKVKLLNEEISKDVYQNGLNVFFNFKSLWDEN